MSTLNQFKNRLPIHRRKKELVFLIIISLATISTIFLYTYILNNPLILTKYPRIDINYEDNPNYNNFVNCTFELSSQDLSENIPTIKSRIKIRGSNTNWNEKAPKKGYRLELSKTASLLGMRKDDDWLLLAMYYDSPRMRVKLSFDLWRSLEKTNPTAILPETEYVSLYINGEFQGLYLLAERNDRRLFNLNNAQKNINSSLIFQAKGYIKFREYDRNQWEQDWPNEDENIFIMDEILTDLISFVNNSGDVLFFDNRTGIYSKFDKLNLIDFYIYNFFILHLDFWHGNYFIVRNSYPSKFYLIPWDFDFSFGQFGGGDQNVESNPESEIREVNKLYNRLLNDEEFVQACKKRWKYLREDLWTEEFILDMVSAMYEEIKDILEFEAEMWDPSVLKSNWEFNIDDSINNLFEWIPNRLDFCDLYFAE